MSISLQMQNEEANKSGYGGGGYERVQNEACLTWKNLTYTVGKEGEEKTILNNISGYVRPGDLLVILGPSGSGKTSLLSILSGMREHTSGEIRYNGRIKVVEDVSEDIMGFGGNASYVAQDDTLMGSITLEETLRYAAELKISDPTVDKEARINSIIKNLGLKNARNTIVGTTFFKGLSGGQKRRLSIGIELVTQPSILFLDEVTSGLDATSAFKLMRLISNLAHLGHAIIMTLHQPTSRIFDLIANNGHSLQILESGNVSYFGPAKDSITYFNSIGYEVAAGSNATDFFLDLVNRDFEADETEMPLLGAHQKQQRPTIYDENGKAMNPDEVADHINKTFMERRMPEIVKEIDVINEEYSSKPMPEVDVGTSLINQFLVLTKRNNWNILRNPGIFWLRLVMYLLLCLVLGGMFWNIPHDADSTHDKSAFLFFGNMFFAFMGISGMPAFVELREVYMRERMNNHYTTITYWAADFVTSTPWIVLMSYICSSILYSMAHLRWSWEHYWIFSLGFFMNLIVAEAVVMVTSAGSPHYMIGIALGGGHFAAVSLLAGFVIRVTNMAWIWKFLYYVMSFQNWTWRIFMDNEYRDNDNVNKQSSSSGLKSGGNEVLRDYSLINNDIGFDFLVLFINMVVYRVIFYLMLRFLNRRGK